MKKQTEKAIKEMVRRIVAQFQPKKIILFGSHARGTAGRDSDVDLLVVMPVRGSKLKTELQIQTVLDDIRLSKDVIVSDPADFEWRKDVVGTIEWPAVHEGKVLYAKT
jgi:predicted nucleotidyltransferase